MKITANNSTIEDTNSWNIPINKRIKEITFEYDVVPQQKQWLNNVCPLILEYIFWKGKQQEEIVR